MTSLTRWRAAWACRVMGLWAAVSTGLMPLGCTDTTNNSDAELPVAVTQSGARVMRVERNDASHRIAAELIDAGEPRTVTFRAFEDGPMPMGLTARIDGGGAEPFEVSMSWDPSDGAVWMRQQTPTDALEVSRSVRGGRVYELCALNGKRVEIDYPVMSEAQLDRAVAHWRRGELDMAPAGIRELGDAFTHLDALAAAYAGTSLAANANRDLLVSVWNDPAFAGAISGGVIDPLRTPENPARMLCRFLSLCAGVSCRFFAPACSFCMAGVMACLIVDIACEFIGCDCCF